MIEGTQPDIYDLLAEADTPKRTACPRCGHRHSIGGDTTVAGSRFTRPTAYRARYDGAPTRATREQAIQDMCDHRAAQHTARNDTKETKA